MSNRIGERGPKHLLSVLTAASRWIELPTRVAHEMFIDRKKPLTAKFSHLTFCPEERRY